MLHEYDSCAVYVKVLTMSAESVDTTSNVDGAHDSR